MKTVKNYEGESIPLISPELDSESLLWILDHIFGNIFVTDGAGKILFVNRGVTQVLKKHRYELINQHATVNMQENGGLMSRSTTLEAIEKRRSVMGGFTVNGANGDVEYFSTSTPMIDDNGDVQLVLTYSHEKVAIDTLTEAVEQEHKNAENYKHALKYMRNLNSRNNFIYKNQKMKDLVAIAEHIARLDSTVLICGESGTGKEVLANYIQMHSHRKDEPFIQVNCAAIPPSLMESEFFGYAKGAFTGANKEGKPGVFEIANRGILMLDEIGELPLDLQSKLLRVLETSEFYRIGSTKLQKTDVRLIAATNKDLRKQVADRLFREDLFYRLNVIPVTIPPLREREDDIEPLATHFLKLYNEKYELNHRFSPEVVQALEDYAWPGNVRELRNIIERMTLTSTEEVITLENVIHNPILSENLGLKAGNRKATLSQTQQADSKGEAYAPDSAAYQFKELHRQKIIDALLTTNGNKVKAAKLLNISPGKLYRLLKQL